MVHNMKVEDSLNARSNRIVIYTTKQWTTRWIPRWFADGGKKKQQNEEAKNDFICIICLDELPSKSCKVMKLARCNHSFCKRCMEDFVLYHNQEEKKKKPSSSNKVWQCPRFTECGNVIAIEDLDW